MMDEVTIQDPEYWPVLKAFNNNQNSQYQLNLPIISLINLKLLISLFKLCILHNTENLNAFHFYQH